MDERTVIQFDLTAELIDQIIFSMENQQGRFVVDAQESVIIGLKEADESLLDIVYYLLPVWSPADGFSLMENFVNTQKNPYLRGQLRKALQSGRGVFRKFKDILKEKDEYERLWYSFKENRMKARVVRWYNEIRDFWGLQGLPLEIGTSSDDLILSDFQFRMAESGDWKRIREIDSIMRREVMQDVGSDLSGWIQDKIRLDDNDEDYALLAEQANGDMTGFIWFSASMLPGGKTAAVLKQIYVSVEYRGLGLSKMLIDRFLQEEVLKKADHLICLLSGKGLYLKNYLNAHDFKSRAEMLIR